VTWEGYLSTGVFILVLVAIIVGLHRAYALMMAAVVVAIALFSLLGWWKGTGEGGWRKR
jgi:hypothetical protein